MNRASVLPIAVAALALAAAVPAAAATTAAKPAAKPASKTTPAARMVLPFVEDDYQKALHDARARGIPIFIEAWAPW